MSAGAGTARRTKVGLNNRSAFNLILFAVILVGFALRAYRLGAQSFWEEEIFSLDFYAKKSILEIIRFNIAAGDPQPPLYYILLHLWSIVAGLGAFGLRFLSLITGVLSIPAMYQFGKSLFGRRIGLLAAIIAAVNPFQIWYSQEARTYSLTLLLTLMSSILLLRAIVSVRRRTIVLIAYVIVTNLAIFSHYYAYFVVLAHGMALLTLWLWRARRAADEELSGLFPGPIWPLSAALAAIFVPYLPWVPYAARVIGAFTGWHTPISPVGAADSVFSTLSVGPTIDGLAQSVFTWFFAILFAGGLVGYAWSSFRHQKGSTVRTNFWAVTFALVYLALPLVGAISFIQYTHRIVFNERYFIIIAPALTVFFAIGVEAGAAALQRLWRKPKNSVLASASYLIVLLPIFGASGVNLLNLYSAPSFQKADIRSMLSYIKDVRQDGDVVVTTDAGLQLVISHYDQGAVPIELIDTTTATARQQAIPRLKQIAQRAKKIWYVPYWDSGIDQEMEGWLDQNAYRASQTWFTKARLIEYAVAPEGSPAPIEGRQIRFADLVQTTGFSIPSKPIPSGGIIPIKVVWTAIGAEEIGSHVLLDLEDQRSNHYSRVEADLPSLGPDGKQKIAQNYGLSVPIGTPPGEYDIQMLMLDHGKNVEVANAQGVKTGTIKIKLGEVTVVKGPAFPDGAVPATTPARIDFGDLTFLGHDLPDIQASPGVPVTFSLYWRPKKDISSRLLPEVTVADADGKFVGEAEGSLAEGLYPTDRWTAGEIVRDIRQLNVSARTPTGVYDVRLSIKGPDGKPVGRETTIARLRVAGRSRQYTLPNITNHLDVTFGSFALLEGYDVSTQRSAGNHITVTLYWKAVGSSDVNYKVFVHALDANHAMIGQNDSPPADGKAPTESWMKNEVVVDPHTIEIADGKAVAFFEVGLYDEKSGVRLKTESPGQAAQDDSTLLKVSR